MKYVRMPNFKLFLALVVVSIVVILEIITLGIIDAEAIMDDFGEWINL